MPLSQLSTEALNQIAEVGYALVFPVWMHQPFANLVICLMEDMPEYAAKRSPVVNLSCTGRNLLLGGQSATTELNWVTGNLIVQFWPDL
jgi:hypothetical protein